MRTILLFTLDLALVGAVFSCARKPPPPEKPGPDDGELPSVFRDFSPEALLGLVEELEKPGAEEAEDLLVRSSPKCFPALRALLEKGDRDRVTRLLPVLADHLHPEAPRLILHLALHGDAPWKRLASLETLRTIARECGVDFLRPLAQLIDPVSDEPLRLAALRVLEEQPVPRLARRIVRLLGDPAESIRRGAARALASLVTRDPESASALGKAIDRVNPEGTRLALARILSEADRPEGVRTLHFLLDSRDPGVRLEAVRAVREGRRPRPWPPGLYRRLVDPDPAVFRETLDLFETTGERCDVPEIVPLLSGAQADGERRRIVAGLLDRIAGTDFGLDPPRFRRWALRWMAGAIEKVPSAPPPETLPLAPVAVGIEGDSFPRKAFLTVALLAVLAGVGFLLSAGANEGKRAPSPTPGEGKAVDAPGGTITWIGKWIFDNRILVLLPWFLLPILLFEVTRMPGFGWRIVLYALLLVGVVLRVYCTGFRSWAFRSSGDRHLMTAGPYSYARHPIYMANFLLAVPLFLAVNLWPLTAAFVAWYALTHLAIVLREDEILKFRYGEEWSRYAAEVRRFLPRPIPYRPRSGEFHWEPVFKGMEIPKAVGFLLLLPLALEVLSGTWTDLSARVLHWLTVLMGR